MEITGHVAGWYDPDAAAFDTSEPLASTDQESEDRDPDLVDWG